MNDDARAGIEKMLTEALEPMHEEFLEQSARLSAQRLLLEMLYANSFLNEPKNFNTFMDGLQKLTRENARKSEPMQDDVAIELQARVAAHLERFRSAVAWRLEQGPR